MKSTFSILALESSADETSTAVLFGNRKTKTFKLASNIIYSQITAHQKTGGIVPEMAARMHLPKILPAITLSLKTARTSLEKIDYLAVTSGPGLITSLMIGVDTAKTLAFALGKPIFGINHMEGHLLSALGTPPSPSPSRGGKKRVPPPLSGRLGGGLFPALGLTVSGGHTMLVLIKDIGKYTILGSTLDDAAGEAFDKIAKIIGLPYPGGPQISKLAEEGNPHSFDFPRPMLNDKSYNFSFSGLKTAVLYFWREEIKRIKNQESRIKQLKTDIAASTEQAIVDVLVAKTLRAAKAYKVKTVLLGGGVSANKKLRQTLDRHVAEQTTARFLMPDFALSTDNAGMIAIAAFFHALYEKPRACNQIIANPNFELKSWRK